MGADGKHPHGMSTDLVKDDVLHYIRLITLTHD